MNKIFLKLFVFTALVNLISCDDDHAISHRYALQEANSKIKWKGYSPVVFNVGSFSEQCDDLEVLDGKFQNGTFIIPIVSIQNFDISEDVKPQLVNHLKSTNFCNIARHPNATFKITKVEPSSNPMAETNFTVKGVFTMF